MDMYGKELILDLHGCNTPFSREDIAAYFEELCKKIDMDPCEIFWWDDEGLPKEERQTEPHLKGISAVQFIMTSNITIHTLDLLGKVFVNVFSCKDFDPEEVERVSIKHFGGEATNAQEFGRY